MLCFILYNFEPLFFCNTSPGTRGMHSREWIICFGKCFCLFFSSERKNISPIVEALINIPIKKDGLGTPEYSDVGKGKTPKFSTGKCGTDSVRDGGKSIIQRQPPTEAQVRKP